MNMNVDQMENLDNEKMGFGAELVRAALWSIVFLECIIIYGVR